LANLTSESAPASLRSWLLADTPDSRRQAALGRSYRRWLQFRRNHLAMTGLVIVTLLILAALASPLLATHDPAAIWAGTSTAGCSTGPG
jgi:peptide/nickel transport system permease protein